MEEFRICRVVVVGYDGDPIFELEGERENRVVNQDDILERPVLEDAEVFDVGLADNGAALAVEPKLKVASVWINEVENGVGVGLVGGCEDSHLEVIISFLETLQEVGPQIEAGL
jgi:hypothetical protein